jgi:hypothetical protein
MEVAAPVDGVGQGVLKKKRVGNSKKNDKNFKKNKFKI